MQIKIEPGKANIAGMELLELSRSVRRSRESVEDVRRQLRSLSELEECKRALQRQEDALELITARLVNMSSAMREITEAYRTAEERNLERLEDRPPGIRTPGDMAVYGGGELHRRIQNVLYK